MINPAMWLCLFPVWLPFLLLVSGDQQPVRRTYGLHPSERYGRTIHRLQSDQGTYFVGKQRQADHKYVTFVDDKSQRVETWLESYQDLLGHWIEDGIYQVRQDSRPTQ